MMSSPMEPMTMGSPASPTHSPYLPHFLMGEQTPMVSSPNSRMWNGKSSSPPKMSLNNKVTSPSNLNTSSVFNQSLRNDQRLGRDILSSRGKDKSSAPPVQGLMDQSSSAMFPTPDGRVDMNNSVLGRPALFNSQMNAGTPTYNTPQQRLMNNSQMNTSELSTSIVAGSVGTPYTGPPKKTPPSPAQLDPFYTQGESLCPQDELDETWVSVFGFPPAATSFILQQFSQYGNILKHVSPSEGNWIHLHYQSRLQAKKALSKTGKIFAGNIMIGVTQCIDKSVMHSDSEFDKSGMGMAAISTPTQPYLNTTQNDGVLNGSMMTKAGTPIRPLTAAYRAASSEQQMIPSGSTPQKNSNVITKAMDYMFGW